MLITNGSLLLKSESFESCEGGLGLLGILIGGASLIGYNSLYNALLEKVEL